MQPGTESPVSTRNDPLPVATTGLSPTDEGIRAIQRRTLAVVTMSQVLGGAGLAAGITVGGLLAQEMLGGEGVAGLPIGVFTLGSAAAAFTVGRFSQRAGRRAGLAAGFLAGGIGAVGIVIAAVLDSPALFFLSLLVYGAGSATNLQARYAGTDLATPATRATAASAALVATTLGAVAGPNLTGPLGGLAHAVGVPRLAGPFLLAALAYLAAGTFLFLFLKPDPLLVARTLVHDENPGEGAARVVPDRPTATVAPGVVIGATVMVLTQASMVAIMTMTPVQMRHHHHGLDAVGMVIGFHIAAMYLPSLVTGRLVDRVGRIPMAIAAALTLLVAGVVAATAPPMSMAVITLALVLLGLGWNLGLISGTTLIVDSTPLESRARTQGSVDVLVALAGAGGGAVSGFVVDVAGFGTLTVGFGVLALVLIPVAVGLSSPRRALSSRA